MTQEDKELLLKDLCARLPYGVKAKYYGSAEECECCDTIEGIYPMDDEIVIGQYGLSVDRIKPYLFPLSSMTKEQQEEFDRIYADDMQIVADNLKNRLDGKLYETNFGHYRHIDWLNAHHFDYRGLIPMGLAIDATGLNVY